MALLILKITSLTLSVLPWKNQVMKNKNFQELDQSNKSHDFYTGFNHVKRCKLHERYFEL